MRAGSSEEESEQTDTSPSLSEQPLLPLSSLVASKGVLSVPCAPSPCRCDKTDESAGCSQELGWGGRMCERDKISTSTALECERSG
ncbi:MAG: hypothetical protein SGPRY_003795 [Prymnesium sp.]